MTPFPKHFEIPTFDKFRRKGDLLTHVKEVYMHCQEVAFSDVFLMHLFSKSLGGPTLEWFYRYPMAQLKLLLNFQKPLWPNMITQLRLSYMWLIQSTVNKNGGESLDDYFQRWKTLTTQISCTIIECHFVKMFINNAYPSPSHPMTMNQLQTYKDIKEKGMVLKKGPIKD